jgi:hypothetical protein
MDLIIMRKGAISQLNYLISDFVGSHGGYFADFKPIVIQKSDIQDQLKIIIIIKTDVGIRSFWIQQIVALFPNTKRVGLYPRQLFQILD